MNKVLKISILSFLVACLVAVRAYAPQLFYDPLIAFFKASHAAQNFPEIEIPWLVLNVGIRFWLNTFISLAILWVLFQKKDIVRFSLILYCIVYIFLLIVFLFLVKAPEKELYMLLFYVRRFLIHPILLLLLIPAFYFQRNVK
ncbi:exosortase F system-associated protein [Aureisphaera sp. CAU 1614]|uniref:Exosortase F system-associated protein n=1 Tax=Halomarinibacterium sedimenti TaxID=2857106 RepID=A0A9X1FLG6_9FLAO|nr:exosortase F system-associated protein [Halomarinibacterium sedimenti]MBW2936823.1 exosortase F system-associated protein [Halomarinibacterium sedimenti]